MPTLIAAPVQMILVEPFLLIGIVLGCMLILQHNEMSGHRYIIPVAVLAAPGFIWMTKIGGNLSGAELSVMSLTDLVASYGFQVIAVGLCAIAGAILSIAYLGVVNVWQMVWRRR